VPEHTIKLNAVLSGT